MVTTIKKGASKEEINTLFEKLQNSIKKKGFDAYKFCGTIKFKEDGLIFQKRLRNEWE
jgi:hypothetical protein